MPPVLLPYLWLAMLVAALTTAAGVIAVLHQSATSVSSRPKAPKSQPGVNPRGLKAQRKRLRDDVDRLRGEVERQRDQCLGRLARLMEQIQKRSGSGVGIRTVGDLIAELEGARQMLRATLSSLDKQIKRLEGHQARSSGVQYKMDAGRFSGTRTLDGWKNELERAKGKVEATLRTIEQKLRHLQARDPAEPLPTTEDDIRPEVATKVAQRIDEAMAEVRAQADDVLATLRALRRSL